MAIQLDREAWLTEAAGFVLDDIIQERPESRPFRVSVGFPSNRGAGKAIASCWVSAASADGTNEIFVSPIVDDSIEVLAALCHELIHYVDDCQSGHRGFFAATARRIGLVGKLTATQAGPELQAKLAGIVELLGPIPHAKVDPGKARTKQSTRMLKVSCSACDFICRTTLKHIQNIDEQAGCPVCGSETFGSDAAHTAANAAV